MKLVALKEQVYAGKTIMPGETFEAASPRDARTLQAIGRAKLAADEPAKASKPAAKDAESTYRTRRLKAD